MNSTVTDIFPEPDLLLGRRILLVDDDPHFLTFLQHLLKKRGIECLKASDGRRGLDLLATETVDVILSDIDMPEMDGYQFLSAVRQQPSLEGLPFILLTGKPAYSGLLSGLRQGADSYLPKPFKARDILDTIKNCLIRRQRQEEKASAKFDEQRNNVLKMLPHEFRTPLTGILGVADLLEMGEASEDELREYGEILRASSERMLRLTTNFVQCAQLQMQAEQPSVKSALFDDQSHAETQEIELILEMRALSYKRAEDLDYQIAPARLGLPPEAHSKILDEILDNAFKFSSLGERVTVTGEITGDLYRWQIEDRGHSGTMASFLESRGLFVQFDRKNREQQGAGMGLYLVEKVCASAGGKLGFFSTPGGGITVEILLPMVTETALTDSVS